MSPKHRFPVMLEPYQLEGLRLLEAHTGTTPSEQIRRAIEEWLARHGVRRKETERKRVRPRRRS